MELPVGLLGECEGVYIIFVYKNEVNKDYVLQGTWR